MHSQATPHITFEPYKSTARHQYGERPPPRSGHYAEPTQISTSNLDLNLDLDLDLDRDLAISTELSNTSHKRIHIHGSQQTHRPSWAERPLIAEGQYFPSPIPECMLLMNQ